MHWEADGADDQRFAGTELTDLSIAGDRLFAIGSTSTDDRGGSRGAVWFTDDGRSWTEATGSLSDRWLTSLSGGDDGLLLIGAANGGGGPVAWRSDDGTAWEEQPLELPVARSHAGFGAVAALGDGWHAAGWVSRAHDGPAAPVIWRSGDGVSWSCHLLDAGGYSRAEARSLHQAGAAWLATGSAAEGCGPAASCIGYPIGWVSDSLTWSEALLDGEPASLGGTAIASAGDMFVAVSHGRTFVSSDGFHWTSVGEDGWDGQVDALVVRDDGRLVGVGTIYTGSDAGPLIVTGDLAP